MTQENWTIPIFVLMIKDVNEMYHVFYKNEWHKG